MDNKKTINFCFFIVKKKNLYNDKLLKTKFLKLKMAFVSNHTKYDYVVFGIGAGILVLGLLSIVLFFYSRFGKSESRTKVAWWVAMIFLIIVVLMGIGLIVIPGYKCDIGDECPEV